MSRDPEIPPKKTPKRKPRRNKKNNNLNNNLDEEIIDESPKSKKPKKSRCRTNPIDYADENAIAPSTKTRKINGIILSNTKPSYCLRGSIGSCLKKQGVSLRAEYKNKLRSLLKKMIKRHNWVEAAGVLRALLKATTNDKSSRHNRFKYWATMEIWKQIKGDSINSREIWNIYDLRIKKAGNMMPRTMKERFAIQCEHVLFCLTDGALEDAKQNALGLMQERGFETDPISNLVVGLTFYELWYSSLPTEWQLKKLNYTSMQSEFHEARSNSDGYNAVESQEDYFPEEVNSDTSVANDKENTDVDSAQERVPMDVDDNLQTQSPQQSVPRQQSVANDKENTDVDSAQERVPMDVDDNLQTQSPQQSVLHGDSYAYSDEGSEDRRSSSPYDGGLTVSIFQTPGLPTWLLPLEMPPINDDLEDAIYAHKDLQNEDYINVVKHLQVALHSTPPMAEALHPLIQVLMIGDRVNEALSEIDNFFDDSASALKLRLKVGFLEHFDRGNHLQLSSCYEEILEIDPTCSNSLLKLINMYQRGDYGIEKLVKMIALYLDATYAEFHIWKHLASCLLKLSQSAGDQMSIYFDGNGEEINQSYTGRSKQIPELFVDRESGKTWRFRCRWWLTRHFSSNILASEIASGEFQLLTYKAAVAAFLYGPRFRYVTKASEILENESTNQDMYSILRIHVQNSVGIL